MDHGPWNPANIPWSLICPSPWPTAQSSSSPCARFHLSENNLSIAITMIFRFVVHRFALGHRPNSANEWREQRKKTANSQVVLINRGTLLDNQIMLCAVKDCLKLNFIFILKKKKRERAEKMFVLSFAAKSARSAFLARSRNLIAVSFLFAIRLLLVI